ncbi:transporter [candidate division KSB1 bacterium]|nr:transporter [candidate division KSB1 bacterium]
MITRLAAIIFSAALAGVSSEALAQGPPINTDSPILLGISGKAVRTFGKVMRLNKLLQDGNEIADPMAREVTVWVQPFAVPYNLTDDFQIAGIFPYVNANLNTRGPNLSSSGLGDIQFFAKYAFYKRDRKNETFRAAGRVNVKLPTGDEKAAPALGSGSTDYTFSAVAGWIKRRAGVYLEGGYALNTSNGGVDYGNGIAYDLALGYRLLPAVYETYPSPQLNAFLEINGATTAKNKVNGVADANSGGTTIFLSPGLQYIGGRLWLVEASFQYPIIDEPNGLQLGTAWTASLGLRLLLY